MSYHHLPKKPITAVAANRELLGLDDEPIQKSTVDYRQEVDVATVPAGVQSFNRAPTGRVNGNEMFRRYLTGILDVDYAAHQVIDAIHRVKAGAAPLWPHELTALEAIFPGSFGVGFDNAMAASVSRVQFGLMPSEVLMIRAKVAAHLAEELNWNAGYGGGTVPGRSSTYEG